MSATTGTYHKAIIGAVAGGIVAALSTITGAMTIEQTLGDIPTVIWLSALLSFFVGSGVTGGSVAISKANTRTEDITYVAQHALDEIDPNPMDPNEDE
jgi:hypothetical protein